MRVAAERQAIASYDVALKLPANLLELPPNEVVAYRKAFPIQECGEPLLELPSDFLRVDPHPYAGLGAPYNNCSPFSLRSGVIQRLKHAAQLLDERHPGHRLLIADCYRPIAVQRYMIEHTLNELARAEQLNPATLSPETRARLSAQVLSIWSQPSEDPNAPPPHSTGGAIDLTIATPDGARLEMGSPLDAFPPEGLPDHFASYSDAPSQRFHTNRQLLRSVMYGAGFVQLPWEWWHFSYGDQWWGLLKTFSGAPVRAALYGRAA